MLFPASAYILCAPRGLSKRKDFYSPALNRGAGEGGTAKGLPGRLSVGDPSLDGCGAKADGEEP